MFYYSGWVACSNRVARYILCHNRAGTNNHVVPDCYSRKNCGPSPNPYIISYGDRFSPFYACISFRRINWMAAVNMFTLGPIKTLSPIDTLPSSKIVRLKLAKKLFPIKMLQPKSHLKGWFIRIFVPWLPNRVCSISACFWV